MIGGLATAVVVYLLSYRNGLAGFRLIIVGIAVSAVLSSLCQWIILKIRLHTGDHGVGLAAGLAERAGAGRRCTPLSAAW